MPLKSQAARERWAPEKGLKDRIDVLSLLLYSDWKPEIFTGLTRKFDPASHHVNVLLRTVKESRVEYSYLGLRYEREGRKLRGGTIDELLTRPAQRVTLALEHASQNVLLVHARMLRLHENHQPIRVVPRSSEAPARIRGDGGGRTIPRPRPGSDPVMNRSLLATKWGVGRECRCACSHRSMYSTV